MKGLRVLFVDWLAFFLVFFGGVTLGLVGFFGFNLVGFLFGGMIGFERWLYAFVGVASVFLLFRVVFWVNDA